MDSLGVIMQARVSSTRLPKKMLLPFYNEKTILDILIENIRNNFKGKIIVATSLNESDEKIVEAKDNSTIVTLKKLAPVRLFKNEFGLLANQAERSGAKEDELLDLLGKKREKMGIFEGDIQNGELEMGQSSGLVKEIKSVKDIISVLLKEYTETIRNIS